MSEIVITVIGHGRHRWPDAWDELCPSPPGFRWRFVPEDSLGSQVRSILRIEPQAVVVWVGSGQAIDRAQELTRRLRSVGLPIVIVIAQEHDPATELLLRQSGAMYLCGDEAEERLGQMLASMLGPPARASPARQIDSTDPVKLDGS